MTRRPAQRLCCLLAVALLVMGVSSNGLAKGYSSGGHSYSSHSSSTHISSHSSGSGSGHSFSSGSHSFSSGGSHSSSGSSTHSSGSSSSSGSSHSFSSGTHTFSSGGSHSSRDSSTHTASSGGSSGSTRTYSSGSHSSSSDSGSSTRTSSSEPKSYRSGTGKSYSSGSTWSDSGRHSYTAGKSYSSGSGHLFSSGPGLDSAPSTTFSSHRSEPEPSSSGMTFDSAAARARKEQASQETFQQYQQSQLPPPQVPDLGSTRSAPVPASTSSYRVQPPPIPSSSRSDRTVYVPDTQVLTTRPVRVYNVFNPYYSRPVVVYRDPYSSLFWWWLLDRSLEDRAYWAYHHRYDMDPVRYQALLDNDRQLEARVAELEAQQAPRDPNFTPAGLERDLMYSDQHVARVYSNRPTTLGVIAFWALCIPIALGFTVFFVWLIWFKRWQTAT